MMEVSRKRVRRSRYERDKANAPVVPTPRTLRLAGMVATLGVSTTPQQIALSGLEPKTLQREMRKLLDLGMVRVIVVPRAALAPYGARDQSLAFGAAPNITVMTKVGMRRLVREELLAKELPIPDFTVTSGVGLRHRLLVNSIRIWFAVSASHAGSTLSQWREGDLAAITLSTSPRRVLRPDAVVVLSLPENRSLACLIEADRGTERVAPWVDKIERYAHAFTQGLVSQATGLKHARLVVVTESTARRDRLQTVIAEHAPDDLLDKVWIANLSDLSDFDLSAPAWVRPSVEGPTETLLPPSVLKVGTSVHVA